MLSTMRTCERLPLEDVKTTSRMPCARRCGTNRMVSCMSVRSTNTATRLILIRALAARSNNCPKRTCWKQSAKTLKTITKEAISSEQPTYTSHDPTPTRRSRLPRSVMLPSLRLGPRRQFGLNAWVVVQCCGGAVQPATGRRRKCEGACANNVCVLVETRPSHAFSCADPIR